MQKLRQLVNTTALSLGAVVIVLFIASSRLRLGSPGLATILSGSPFAGRPGESDMFQGEWVPDDVAPYYTNRTCAIIQQEQNCMKYGRPDLGFLNWRWRPKGCELPRFDPAGFFHLVQNRSMVFVGDSLARNQMQSLVCLLSKVEYPTILENIELRTTLYYESYNFTLSMRLSRFLVRAHLSAGNDTDRGVWNLYLDEPHDAWVPFVSGSDYVIISAAMWFTHPSMFYDAGGRLVGCHSCHVPGVPELRVRYALRAALRTALRAITGLEGFTGTAIVRTLTPTSHFEGGEWHNGGDCRRTRPYVAREIEIDRQDLELHEAQVQVFQAAEHDAARGDKSAMSMMLLDTTFAMVLRPDGHPSRYGHWPHEKVAMYNDCVHWCLPGPVDLWNQMLLQMLLDA